MTYIKLLLSWLAGLRFNVYGKWQMIICQTRSEAPLYLTSPVGMIISWWCIGMALAQQTEGACFTDAPVELSVVFYLITLQPRLDPLKIKTARIPKTPLVSKTSCGQ